jgi:DNA-binding MarR family transcriptional regulator/predicted GNAT family acetyltransferase
VEVIVRAPVEPTPSTEAPAADLVAAVRRFNRFYTRRIGVLDEGHLHSAFSLAEVRVMYEIAHDPAATATGLQRDLQLDGGYLSRLVSALEQKGLVRRKRSPNDGRQSLLALTAKGRTTFAQLNARAHDDVASFITPLGERARWRLLDAMRTIESLLGGEPRTSSPYLLRAHRAGDMGFVVHRQAVLYSREYGWTDAYEALISRIVAEFLERFDAARERCWIAERDGETVGSVFLIRHPEREGVAKLRLLYVEPSARGLGIGARLVRECSTFARAAGYHTITLWTNSVLTSARRLYEAEGYRLVHEEPHHSFGKDLAGQTWELTL